MKSSRRPISISAERIHLHMSGITDSPPVLPVSATRPILDTQENELKNASTSDIPQAVNAIPPTVIIMTYMHRNAITFSTISGEMMEPLIRTDRIALG